MKKENRNVVYCPPCGESTLKGGKGGKKGITFVSPSIGTLCHFLRKGGRSGGFTLIELLVVVLIIGILAAVAVPQYQKAVLKSRMSELLTLQKSVADAQRVYFLANGTYPEHFSQLDLDIGNLTASNDSQLSGSGLASNEDVARYNNFFQIVLGTEGNTSNIIKGKYKGCGFNINFKTGELICKEWFYWYKEPAGSFCHKIMGTGETFTTANNVRYFPM